MTRNLSFFLNLSSKIPSTVTLDEIYRYISGGSLCEQVERIRYFRSQGRDAEADRVKRAMPAFAVSLQFSGGRTRSHAIGYTSLVMADFDKLPGNTDFEKIFFTLRNDPHVILAYRTSSWYGLRVIYLTDVTDVKHHPEAFTQGNAHYERLLGLKADTQCKDATRLSLLSHDPSACYNPDAVPMPIRSESRGNSSMSSRKRFRHSFSEAYSSALDKTRHSGKIYRMGSRNSFVSSLVYELNRLGVESGEVNSGLAELYPDFDVTELSGIVRSVYSGHEDEFGTVRLRKSPSRHRNDIRSLESFLCTVARFRYNVITGQREYCYTGNTLFVPLTDREENSLWVQAQKSGINCNPGHLQMLLNSEFVEPFNPFVQYLNSLSAWDGVDHIGRLASTVHTGNDAFFREGFRRWLVGIVASLCDSDKVNQIILVFVGAQGIYKSTFFNNLLPPEWRRYYSVRTCSSRMTRDDRLILAENALVCLEELDEMRPSEMNELKACITLKVIKERAAYARNKEYRPHIASFCGTGNNRVFLNDPTGTRRFLVFDVEKIDDPFFREVDYDALYAQAYHLYNSGFKYWFDSGEHGSVYENNSRFEIKNIEEELLSVYFRKPLPGDSVSWLSASEIHAVLSFNTRSFLSLRLVSIVLAQLGYQKRRMHNIYKYKVHQLTASELEEIRKIPCME